MKLESFQIKNIKSIINSGVCHLSEDNITVLAGQNESGKSAILEALKYFTKGIDEFFEKYLMRTDNTEPYVECIFSLEDNDRNFNDDNYINLLKFIKQIKCYRKGAANIAFSDETRVEFFQAAQTLIKKKSLTGVFDANSCCEEDESETGITIEDFIKEVEETLLEYIPVFDYYNSFDNILPEEIAITDIEKNEAVKDFQTVLNVNLADYVKLQVREKKQSQQRIEQDLRVDFNDCWTQRLSGEDENTYKFLIENENNKIMFLVDRENNTPLYISQKSKGFQWFVAFYLRLKALNKAKENLSEYILLIDEPGQGLHETAQLDVKKVLEELAKSGIQIIYTTHHSKLIDIDEKITRLRLVYQDSNNGTLVKTLSQMASYKNQQTLDTLSPIRTAMGMVHFSCMDLSNNKNVIVEGITDKYYIESFAKLLNINFDYNIIPACGCENIKNIASILLGWGYAFKIIIDKGEGQNSREAKAQKLIQDKLFANDDAIVPNVIKRLSKVAIEDLFSLVDFRSKVKPEEIEHSNKTNVTLAKELGKKELWSRLFAEKVNTGIITSQNFEQETIDNFSELLAWIQAE